MQIVRAFRGIALGGVIFAEQALSAQLDQSQVGCLSGQADDEIGQQLTPQRKASIMLASKASVIEILRPRDPSPTVYRSDRVIILINDEFIIKGILCE